MKYLLCDLLNAFPRLERHIQNRAVSSNVTGKGDTHGVLLALLANIKRDRIFLPSMSLKRAVSISLGSLSDSVGSKVSNEGSSKDRLFISALVSGSPM